MAKYKVLSEAQVERFMEDGFTCLRGGFPRAMAEPVLAQVWANLPPDLGIRRDDPTTWKHAVAMPAAGPKGPEVAALYTPRVRAAIDDLVGEGRWVERGERTGAWPITFPGFATKPWKSKDGWHIDGGGQRRLNGPQQGLIAIMLFSDIGPGDGGTAIRVGSHKCGVRALLDAEPAGLSTNELNTLGPGTSKDLPVIEAQGEIGDLVLCHAYLVHSGSENTGQRPRIITNNCITLHEPMRFDRENPDDFSPLERSIVEVIRERRA